MKKTWKTWIAGGAVITLLAGVAAIPALAISGQQAAILNYSNMKITLDGKSIQLTDSYGNPTEPFTINDTSYLPVASISKALGLNVSWDQATNTIVLTSSSNSQNTGNTNTGTNTDTSSGSYIGEEKAKTIALNHAGVSSSNTTFLRSYLEFDDGRAVYDVDFWSSNREYDYEIDALTGTILSYDSDIEWYNPNTSSGNTQSNNDIGVEKAKTIALNHAGVSASNAVFLHAKLDYDDGRRTYEVEFRSGNQEYDYEIDAASGDILSYDYDAERYTPTSSGSSNNSGSYIGEAKAKQIVEARAGTTGTYREFKLERDDGRAVYEGELRSGGMEYDFTIDALTGTILEWETDYR